MLHVNIIGLNIQEVQKGTNGIFFFLLTTVISRVFELEDEEKCKHDYFHII